MDIQKVDLNLLLTFDAMRLHRNVTRAGEALDLSQPAMSAALSRLRALFDDQLFVRSGSVMQPTAKADALAEPIRRIIQTIRAEILLPSVFLPAESERGFTLITPDIGEFQFVPPLLEQLKQVAPKVTLHVVSRPKLAAADALATGEADLAVGYYPDLKGAGFFQQKLFENRHVCLVRQGHPRVLGDKLTLNEYLALEHVVEEYLARKRIQRRVVLQLSHFMSLLPIVELTDLVATVPMDMAQTCLRYADLRIVKSPVNPPAIPIHQFWHRRAHKDHANAWLRTQVQQVLARH